MKLEIHEKAWEVDFIKVDEGFLYAQQYCYAENVNKAKSILLKQIEDFDVRLIGELRNVTYTNIPIKRCQSLDKFIFDGKPMTKRQIEDLKREKKRNAELDRILKDKEVSHCYIKKRGQYYRPNSCGYTDFQHRAGVYEKQYAVSSAVKCHDLVVVPINTFEHNQIIKDEIADLKTRLI